MAVCYVSFFVVSSYNLIFFHLIRRKQLTVVESYKLKSWAMQQTRTAEQERLIYQAG
jgi:hypothetical protein